MYPTTIPANIVPKPIPWNEPYNSIDNMDPIITLEESNIDLILPNSILVTCLTAKDTPSPGSTMAFEVTSKYTPKAMIKQLTIHNIH